MARIQFERLTYVMEEPYQFNDGLHIEYAEEKPAYLFKYFSPSKYNLQSIMDGKLYFAHPYRFNDITDSNPLSFDFNGLSFNDYSRIFDGNVEEKELLEMYENEVKEGFSAFRVLLYSLWTQKIGLCCFSTNEMHNLMWGHYASDSGFKLKFDSEKLVESLNRLNNQRCMVFPINYINQKLQVNVSQHGTHLPLLVDFSTKVGSWAYENEWRIIMTKNDMGIPNSIKTPNQKDYVGRDNRLFSFDHSIISEIVIGMNFFNGYNTEKSEYVSPTERIIVSKDEVLSSFLIFIIENIPENINNAGIFVDHDKSQFDGTAPMGRSIEKIKINQIDQNKFSLTRVNPDAIKKF